MYAIIENGSKQYRVSEGDVIRVEKLGANVGDSVDFKVLMLADENGVKTIASIPSREILIAKMLGSMQAPISNFAGVLSAMLRGVVVALNAIAEKKGA